MTRRARMTERCVTRYADNPDGSFRYIGRLIVSEVTLDGEPFLTQVGTCNGELAHEALNRAARCRQSYILSAEYRGRGAYWDDQIWMDALAVRQCLEEARRWPVVLPGGES